jgi:TolB protein
MATAQNEITVQGQIFIPGQIKPIPVSISGFSGEAAEVIEFDLYVQGFSFTNAEHAQYTLSGSNNGNVQGRAVDNISKQTLVSKNYTGASVRRLAHAFVDDFVQSPGLGRKGISQTKIAFKGENGRDSEIYIADFDGHNATNVTKDRALVAAPCWAPGKSVLYYTSYKLGNPDIFFHDLITGQRRAIANYSGLNTSASVSPDGRHVAMILSKGGSPDVYVSDAQGGDLQRRTATREDESSPCWSADGQWICFATKIKERRSLCKLPASGGTSQRINTTGVSNPTEPDYSPDGKWIVFTAQMGGFEICVVPAQGGQATDLVSGEDACWAPNSRTVIFTRRQGGSRVLSLLDVPTKQVKDVSRSPGISSQSQPTWAR